jgi:putative membrane protein
MTREEASFATVGTISHSPELVVQKEDFMRLVTFLKTSSFAALILISSTQVYAATASRHTQHFISNAAVANQFEIESSDLALRRTQSRYLRKFAQRMIDDHVQAKRNMKWALREEELRDYMPRDIDRRRQKLLNNLRADSADNFDRDYIDIEKDVHDWEVSFYKDYSRNGDNARLRDYASRMLPILRDHERVASRLERDYRYGKWFSRNDRSVNEIEPSAGDNQSREDRNYGERNYQPRRYQDRIDQNYGRSDRSQ